MNKIQAIYVLCILIFSTSTFPQIPGPTYCGPYTSAQPISLNGTNDLTISELKIVNPNGNCISLTNCHNVTIEKCKLGPALGNGIELYSCTNISIFDCRMDSVATGVYAVASHEISVTYIEVKNILGPYPRGQMVQFNSVYGTGNRINYNVVDNLMGQSNPEDAINIFQTNGTVSDPIQVIGNWIRGGGPSTSGGGIAAGDNGGSYIIVKDNILVDPGQYGIAIVSGTNIQILYNKVYARQQPFTNVGIFVWNQYPHDCSDNTVMGNEVNWTNKYGVPNHFWDGGNCGIINGLNHNIWGANIDSTILPEKILLDCSITLLANEKNLPDEYFNIYPNPFNPTTRIAYGVRQRAIVQLKVFDLLGREVQTIVNEEKYYGHYEVVFDASRLTSGIYFLKLQVGDLIQTKKIVLTK